MWSNVLFPGIFLLFATLCESAARNGAGAFRTDMVNKPKKTRLPTKRIKVPLDRNIADILGDGQPGQTLRSFDIEADDDSTGEAVALKVHEMETAVTGRTTFSFREDRYFDENSVQDLSFLASSHGSSEGITIMSVNKKTGHVKGLKREHNGRTKHFSMGPSRRPPIGDPLEGARKGPIQKLRLVRPSREFRPKNWTCGVAHTHDDEFQIWDDFSEDNVEAEEASHFDFHSKDFLQPRISPREFLDNFRPHLPRLGVNSTWETPMKYSFEIDLSIEVDKFLIERQGSAEATVEYINFLVSAANVIFEHEIDTHLRVVHVQETDSYDETTTAKQALRTMRLKHRGRKSRKFYLYHALLGRHMGGGIAFIDSICDSKWGFGVTTDISGSLAALDDSAVFDLFIFAHELGHSLGSGHTFDSYDPPVDVCGATCPKDNIEGLPLERSGTLMSYCNFCDGGLSNIAITLGGVWSRVEPRANVSTWANSLEVNGNISTEPRRVANNIWQRLNSKGECIRPQSDPFQYEQGCNDDNDCDDNNDCTIDSCQSFFCVVSKTLEDCCGNGICEPGEKNNCRADCGPFTIAPTSFCEDCYEMDGFMFDVGLSDDAEKRIFIHSISFMHPAFTGPDVTVDLYATLQGSYRGKEQSKNEWTKVKTVQVPAGDGDVFQIKLNQRVPVVIGKRRGFYLAASENIILFGEGVYSVKNSHEVELFSSLAVTGLFGTGIDGFSLSCKVKYVLDDSLNFPTFNPTETPTSLPSINPSTNPSMKPSAKPSSQPSLRPSSWPSLRPSSYPSSSPSTSPSTIPSVMPSTVPSVSPSSNPSSLPSDLSTPSPEISALTSQPTMVVFLNSASNIPTSKGVFSIQPNHLCFGDCFVSTGYMFDIGLVGSAQSDISVTSVSFGHVRPSNQNIQVDVYITMEGTYKGKEETRMEWIKSGTLRVPDANFLFADINFDNPVYIARGSRRGFYLASTEDILLSTKETLELNDDRGVYLSGGSAVLELFGSRVEGYSWNGGVEYITENDPSTAPPQKDERVIPSSATSSRRNSSPLCKNNLASVFLLTTLLVFMLVRW